MWVKGILKSHKRLKYEGNFDSSKAEPYAFYHVLASVLYLWLIAYLFSQLQ